MPAPAGRNGISITPGRDFGPSHGDRWAAFFRQAPPTTSPKARCGCRLAAAGGIIDVMSVITGRPAGWYWSPEPKHPDNGKEGRRSSGAYMGSAVVLG